MIFQEALRQSLQAHGPAVAIETPQQRVTYSDLSQQADKITQLLLSKGLPAQTPVGITLTDRAALIAAVIGAANARMVFVPLDPALPAQRKQSLVAELDLPLLIGTTNAGYDGPELLNYQAAMEVTHQPVDYPACAANDSLYVYFTSGSTGRPKGIIGKNCSLTQFIQWEVTEFGIDASIRVSQLISPYFDAFLRDVFVPLMAGGTLCIPPTTDDLFTPEVLSQWLHTAAVQLVHCVPSVFRLFGTDNLTEGSYPALQYVLLSGEKIAPALLKPWYQALGNRVQLVNLYGTTETTMVRTSYRIQPADVKKPKIPIGQPIAGTELVVAKDAQLTPCSPFVAGDLYIVSKYLTKGYLNNEALNAQRFVPVKVGTAQEAVAFKTGDKARMVAGGQVELIGREDRQVKLRGIRVELDELENVLLQHQAVSQAAVTMQQAEGQDVLLAFVVSTLGNTEPLNQWLGQHLPAYMLPAAVVAVPHFPQLSNGKINYKALLAMRQTKTVVAPASPTEQALLTIWNDILGSKEISVDDNFHQIGGNSLSLMRLTARIYKAFNVRIPLQELFKNLSIQKQAAFIDKAAQDNAYVIEPAQPKERYHLSSAQERIYYFYQLDKSSTAFNMPIAWQLGPDTNIDQVKHALRQLVQRHESLRTSFVFEQGQVYQRVHEGLDLAIETVAVEAGQLNPMLARLITRFDLTEAPLFRCFIVQVTNGPTVLLADMHHIVCDGASQMNLLNDFATLYAGQQPGRLPLQYKDYAEWEYQFKFTADYIKHREFWLKAFEGGQVPELALPTEGGPTSNRGGNITFSIDKAQVEPIVAALQGGDVTTFSVWFTLYFVYLSQITGQHDIVVGTNTTGRTQADVDKLVGMFAKTLPIRQQLRPEQQFTALCSQIHQYLVQASSKQVYDLVDVMAELNKDRATPIGQLFSTMFVYQNFEQQQARFEADHLQEYPLADTAAKYPLTLYAHEGPHSYQFRFEYLLSHFTQADMEVLIDQFVQLVQRVAAQPASQLIDFAPEPQNTGNQAAAPEAFSFDF